MNQFFSILLILLLLMASTPMYTQVSVSKADSIRHLLPELRGDEKADALFSLVRLVSFDEKEQILDLAEKEISVGSVRQGRLLKERAILHVIRHEHTECLKKLDEAKVIFEKLDSKRDLTFLNHMYVEVYSRARDYPTAAKYGLRALDVAKEMNDQELIGYSYLALAHTIAYPHFENPYLHQSIEYLENSKSDFLSHAYNNLGYRYYNTGKLDSSLIYHQKALAIKETNQDPSITNTLGNLASLYYKRGEWAMTLQVLERNQELLKKYDDTESLIWDFNLISRALIKLGRVTEAREALSKSDSLLNNFQFGNNELYIDYYKSKKELAYAESNFEAYYTADLNCQSYMDTLGMIEDSVLTKQIQTQKELFQAELDLNFLNKELQYRKWINLGLGALAVLGAGFIFLLSRNQKIKRNFEQKRLLLLDQKVQLDQLEIQNLKIKQDKQIQEKRNVEERLDYRKRQLSASALLMSQKNQLLKTLVEEIDNGLKHPNNSPSGLLQKLKHQIDQQFAAEEDWEQLRINFEEIHPEFFTKLQQSYSNISQNDRRLCALIRMQLSNKEIARVMNVNAASVLKSRYRLRKKLELKKEEDLTQFILNF